MNNTGYDFEEVVASLYMRKGFSVEKNKLMTGKSGVIYELDIYGEKDGLTLAVECKYKSHQKVGLEEIALFLLKLDDLDIKEGHFLTNSSFTNNAELVAKKYNIKLVDGEELKGELRKHGIKYLVLPEIESPLVEAIEATLAFIKSL